jgi:hypothetical protein
MLVTATSASIEGVAYGHPGVSGFNWPITNPDPSHTGVQVRRQWAQQMYQAIYEWFVTFGDFNGAQGYPEKIRAMCESQREIVDHERDIQSLLNTMPWIESNGRGFVPNPGYDC